MIGRWHIPLGATPVVQKVWGTETIFADEPEYCGKILQITPGMQSSLHCHHKKKETFYVVTGPIRIEINSAMVTALRGDRFTLLPGTKHRFGSIGGGMLIEASTQHDDKDVERFEESGPIPEAVE